ncbi:MAG: hypothetical protein ACD_58C00140G0001 [uncultured bacterium]|nr:MAG: hypothetical protein ACD_58C00140G0001 [uncultured bacterium]
MLGVKNSNVLNIKNLDIDLKPASMVGGLKIKNLSMQRPHIITSAFEHHAVLHTCEDLEKQGLAEVTYIKPDKEGIIHVEDIKKAIRPNTVLISIMYVNNEIGTVQPIRELRAVIESCDRNRKKDCIALNSQFTIHNSQIYFHTDAVQAVEYQEMDVNKLGVDMLSLSAHKFGGPKGVGVLYIKKGTPINAIQTGGAQEWHKRAGTENVAGIVGLGKAVELLALRSKDVRSFRGAQASGKRLQPTFDRDARTQKLRNYFIDGVMGKIPDVMLNGSKEKRNPNNINLTFKYIEGEAILLNLDLAGIAASSGSACTSGSLEPSHVLLSIGLKHEDAHGSVRFTLGEKTTKEEIDYTIKKLVEIVKRLRKMSPFGLK